ncbi:hypothetical protein Taro_012704 [Colocasia esculenta]|uniref:Exostosin GT47 domain-containing protein n=1 Tax=Colocasia esculenta TaxID=4460 RepID=A0A843UJY0_COLES|nr:hypothetical protein [Colocasia esculenta]
MPAASLRAMASYMKAELARRRWRRASPSAVVDWRKLILAVVVATTTLAVLLAGALPHIPATKLPSASISYVTDHSATAAAAPLTPSLPLPLLPRYPVTSLVATPRLSPSPSEASGFSLSSSDPAVSSPLDSTPLENFTAEGGDSEEDSRIRSVRSSRSKRPLSSLSPDEALAYAKSEIERSPLVSDDPELHAPLFRNVSVFKRSYELMENILKVYIYKDGEKPIFHRPARKGIYASEGWFMKLIEENRQFVVKNPRRAHLFYLPYSSRQLQEALYVPDSHNIRPLSLFLRDYVNTIAAKYPFWNRTHGSDHFLVACHDWGPYITTAHDELRKNTIKALCNADTAEGIFIQGKDVSLPETTIRTLRRPLKDVGGKPISQRSILAFYAGQMHGRVRPILLKYWGGKDEDMKIYGPLPARVSRVMSYIQHMKSSKFCICPMGYEVNSPRIVEAIYYECVPVIIADNFVPPFDEVLDWSSFSVIVAEKHIPDLKNILQKISPGQYMYLQSNVKKLQKHFLWHAKPVKYDLFHMILHSVWFSRLNHIQMQH